MTTVCPNNNTPGGGEDKEDGANVVVHSFGAEEKGEVEKFIDPPEPLSE